MVNNFKFDSFCKFRVIMRKLFSKTKLLWGVHLYLSQIQTWYMHTDVENVIRFDKNNHVKFKVLSLHKYVELNNILVLRPNRTRAPLLFTWTLPCYRLPLVCLIAHVVKVMIWLILLKRLVRRKWNKMKKLKDFLTNV